MSAPTILLVESDLVQAQQLVQALGKVSLPRPGHVSTGEAAVQWIGAHECDACVLDYQLAGMDGLETLARIHQRKPTTPVIMISAAESETIAVAAFHAGVVDYVPKRRGYTDAVARLVAQVVQSQRADQDSPGVVPGPEVPLDLLARTYENCLRAIGWQLDVDGFRNLYLLEVAGGFLVRVVRPGGARTPEALEFSDRAFPALITRAVQAGARRRTPSLNSNPRLLPMGYQDFLFALGRHLDRRGARAVTVAELDDFVAVGGLEPVESALRTIIGPFQEVLHAEDIIHMVDETFKEREPVPFKPLTIRLSR